KGTSEPTYCGKQLTTAVGQLSEPVFGDLLPGLAVSTVTGAKQVSCVALELTQPKKEEAQDSDRELGRDQGDANAQGALPGLTGRLASGGLETSWAMLGHYAGNQTAAMRWAPNRGKSAGPHGGRRGRRLVFDGGYGPAIGVTTAFDLDDRQLVV